ncbi:MAG: hypothetical protein IJZ20_01520, partial [Clostridia bacterium]|nr:hypothetical protein [Clostridia bacterium]
MNGNKAAVFILLGQSNAVGHAIPMTEQDRITQPLKNVFGLKREQNQTFENYTLFWIGYTSDSMNLAEEQDHTYSVANCLANLWQNEIDAGEHLPDLYIVHIAIGAQGVTDGYMWNPSYSKKLIPGMLGTVDISLFPFTIHILSLIKKSISALGKAPEIIGIHWRGGENDTTDSWDSLKSSLKATYNTIFGRFYEALGEKAKTVIHRIVCRDRYFDLDPSGESAEKMDFINGVFEELECEN